MEWEFAAQVRRDSLPPAFSLPDEVARAAEEPLPEPRSVKAEQEVKYSCELANP